MNIFHVSWQHKGILGLNAVVIADDEMEAYQALELNLDTATDVDVNLIGTALENLTETQVVAEELA
jgi:hypothetical protein